MFLPPGGSIFEQLTGRDGPPMMRMFMINGAYEMASTKIKLGPKFKLAILFIISMSFIVQDFKQFFRERGENVYTRLGLPRDSSPEYIIRFFSAYHDCMEFTGECKDTKRISSIFKIDEEEVKEMEYMLTKKDYREMYDKTEMFIRKKTNKKAPTEGQRYLSAF